MTNFSMMKYDPNLSSISVFDKYLLALTEYTKLPLEEIERLGHLEAEFKEQFTSGIITDPQKIRELYQNSDAYMFANPFYYKDNFEQRWERFWKPIKERPGSVLDYGCGAGVIDEYLLRMGITDITLCDLHSPTWKFVKFFFGNRVKYEEDVDNLTGKYDYIICNSVLEHIPDPLRVVKMWGEHLTERGRIINSMATDVGGPHLKVSIDQYNEVLKTIYLINKDNYGN